MPDSAPDKLRAAWEQLCAQTDSGLWVRPVQRNLPFHLLAAVDLIYLDRDYRVLEQVESSPASAGSRQAEEAVSALVLPPHTIYSSQTQPGDQLVICVAAEMERRLAGLSNAFAPLVRPIAISSNEPRLDQGVLVQNSAPIHTAQEQTVSQGSDAMSNIEPKVDKPSSLKSWLKNWLSSDRRRAHRQPLPGLVAYYWTGSAPRAYQIADISATGFYLLTEERWFPGTMVLMTLQRTDSDGQNLDDSIAVQSLVVRWGSDGLGLAFVLSRTADASPEALRQHGADKKTLERFLARLKQTPPEIHSILR